MSYQSSQQSAKMTSAAGGREPLKPTVANFNELPRPTRAESNTPTKVPSGYDITPNTKERIVELQKIQDNELLQLKRELALSKYQVDGLKNKSMELTTQRQELELDHAILHNDFYKSAKDAMVKEAELEALASQLDQEMENLNKNYELHKRELTLNHDSRIQQLTQSFENKVDQTLKSKVKEIENMKLELQNELKEKEVAIKNLEVNFQKSKNDITNRYEIKTKEIGEMIQSTKNTLANEQNVIESNLLNVAKELELADKENKGLLERKSELNNQVDSLRKDHSDIIERSSQSKEQLQLLSSQREEYDQKIKELERNTLHLKRSTAIITDEYESETHKRRVLNTLLQDLQGNIRVFCRVRPALPLETGQPLATMIFPLNIGEENKEHILLQDENKRNVTRQLDFKFDKVFNPSTTNDDVFEEISPLVQSCINGSNICLFAYGQTGSGKTFTMSEPEVGMIPRTVHQIFEETSKLSALKTSPWEYQITGKFLEIYNDNIVDLIGEKYNSTAKHEIRHDSIKKTTTITGLTEVVLTGAEQVNRLLQKASKNRSTASTKANEHSSRSHSIFILTLAGTNQVTNEKVQGFLNLIDLAGSERLSNSQAVGERLKETQLINKSLSALGDVIAALGSGGSHVPFRNSKLTYLLQYSLSGDSKTLMFVNISPMLHHVNETINSLRFAMKVNNTSIS